MEFLKHLFGEGKDLSALQMGCRAFVIFFITLILIRLAGRRTFGRKSPFDNIIVIMLGAIISRAVAGASPFLPTVAAALVLVFTHRVLAWLCYFYKPLDVLIKGKKRILFQDGEIQYKNLRRSLMNEGDLMESVRQEANADSFKNIKQIFVEGGGQVTVIKKD